MKNKNLEVIKQQQQKIRIILLLQKSSIVQWNEKGKKEVIRDKDPSGAPRYTRNDIYSLQQLLNKFDTRKHQAREWKYWTTVKEKLYDRYLRGKDEGQEILELSIEEAAFLKKYLEELPQEEGKVTPLQENEVRTREGIIEQL